FTEPAKQLETLARSADGAGIGALLPELRGLADRIVVDPGAAKPAPAERPRTEPAAEAPSTGPVRSRLAGNAKLRPTIEKFVLRLAKRLEAMDESLAARDFEALAGHAHWLKGAGGTVGFDAFTGPAALLEQLARESKASEIEATLDEIRGLADRIDLGPST
ncbi:MAG: Hpt domain-containing protein, partial [Myxococcales bacterium]|nr:Hpt domain-containing protein [Myxococcales bacterium]